MLLRKKAALTRQPKVYYYIFPNLLLDDVSFAFNLNLVLLRSHFIAIIFQRSTNRFLLRFVLSLNLCKIRCLTNCAKKRHALPKRKNGQNGNYYPLAKCHTFICLSNVVFSIFRPHLKITLKIVGLDFYMCKPVCICITCVLTKYDHIKAKTSEGSYLMVHCTHIFENWGLKFRFEKQVQYVPGVMASREVFTASTSLFKVVLEALKQKLTGKHLIYCNIFAIRWYVRNPLKPNLIGNGFLSVERGSVTLVQEC